jgi:hypothetical protein
VRYLGMTLDSATVTPWLAAAVVALVGFVAFERVRRRFALAWGEIQSEIEATMTFKEPS